MIRVRIAPSPTGFAHVGTAYMALFNYAFARKNKGKFILRLEDTDVQRNVPEAEAAIYSGLDWLGLSWDEGPDKGGKYGPYRQSQRLDLYQKKIDLLLKKDLAFKDQGAVRFRNPGKEVGWNDLVRGEVKFPGDQITDFVILKSDGFPTYNFAAVIDDWEMKISHVIRGEEHISNTPRQLVLYQAFGVKPPLFAHLPTLRNEKRQKLSKRRDPVDLRIYQEKGYLPEALVNFLCLLGWSHPRGKEVFSLKEFVQNFDLKRVRKAGPIFDLNKLDWLNGEYIRELKDAELVERIDQFFKGKYPKDKIKEIVPLIKQRIRHLTEFETLAGFFFEKPKPILVSSQAKAHISAARTSLEKVKNWSKPNLDQVLLETVKQNGFKTGDFFMDLRGVITGQKVTPPINDSLVILGREETLSRLKKV